MGSRPCWQNTVITASYSLCKNGQEELGITSGNSHTKIRRAGCTQVDRWIDIDTVLGGARYSQPAHRCIKSGPVQQGLLPA